MLNQLITSKTRLRLLIKFFISQANRGYLNGLSTEFNESTNSIRKELNHLSKAGYLEKHKDNNKVEYKANVDHPLFDVLQKVVFKHLGLEEIVDRVKTSCPNGTWTSDISAPATKAGASNDIMLIKLSIISIVTLNA